VIIEVITTLASFPRADFFTDNTHIKIGSIVHITILGRKYFGIVDGIKLSSTFKLKEATHTGYEVTQNFIQYIKEFSFHNFISESFIVKYITDKLPKRVKNFLFPEGCRTNIQLFPEQQEAYESVSSSVNSLLWGITGSGKTEVFFQLIDLNTSSRNSYYRSDFFKI
jgi:hypothetical protein